MRLLSDEFNKFFFDRIRVFLLLGGPIQLWSMLVRFNKIGYIEITLERSFNKKIYKLQLKWEEW